MADKNCHHDELLKIFYKTIFPSSLFCKWLSYGSNESFCNREFSFTLKDDVYVRYLSFKDENEFIEELIRKNPYKIDIGAVYNIEPKNRKKCSTGWFVPEWKELVFDIDMTDYDDVRFCCEKTDICKKCWPLMTVAVKVIDRSLREDFGFQKILWVYSGRRGIHCWVCDKSARELFEARNAIVGYLTYVKGGNKKKKVNLYNNKKWLRNLHPHIVASIEIIKPYFEKYLINYQNALNHENGINRLLSMIPDECCEFRDEMKMKWLNESQSDSGQCLVRWRSLVCQLEYENSSKIIDEIYVEFMYPRLDVNVSTGVTHLLKSPFSVHPSTGRICVPIDIDSVDEFDPFNVPTLDQIITEFRSTQDIHSTSLGKYLAIFERFINDLQIEI